MRAIPGERSHFYFPQSGTVQDWSIGLFFVLNNQTNVAEPTQGALVNPPHLDFELAKGSRRLLTQRAAGRLRARQVAQCRRLLRYERSEVAAFPGTKLAAKSDAIRCAMSWTALLLLKKGRTAVDVQATSMPQPGEGGIAIAGHSRNGR
jgi:hypothetical protein